MSIQGILLIAVIILVLLALQKFKSLPPAEAKKFMIKAGIYAAAGLFVLAAVTGRVHWLMGIAGALVPFIQRLWRVVNTLQWVKKVIPQGSNEGENNTGTGQGQVSEVETGYLRMRLNHETGHMSGWVLQGPEQGKKLQELALPALLSLYQYYLAQDSDSARLLTGYLNLYFPDWRQQEQDPAAARSDMSLDEAYEILGVKPPVDVQTVRDAHRRLIQKMHPDRGGSSYLATQINRAKDLILDHIQ